MTPHITITHDFDEGWLLQATSFGRTAPAGPRLFRAPPHPDVRFRHDTKEGAERDAAVLQRYLDGLAPQKKAKSKAKGAFRE